MNMELTDWSETSAHKIQTPANHTKEIIQEITNKIMQNIKTYRNP